MSIKIFLVEDHEIIRQGIKTLLENAPDTELIGEASKVEEAIGELGRTRPDIVLMGLNTPLMDGTECTRSIKSQYTGIKVLVLSNHDQEKHLIDVIEAGADGYVLKDIRSEELLFAIRKISNGGVYIGPEFTLNVLSKYKAAKGFMVKPTLQDLKLTDREMDVLKLVADGLTNVEMAHRLFTSVRTIETRRKKLLDKTGTNNTATLIKFAVQNGLIN